MVLHSEESTPRQQEQPHSDALAEAAAAGAWTPHYSCCLRARAMVGRAHSTSSTAWHYFGVLAWVKLLRLPTSPLSNQGAPPLLSEPPPHPLLPGSSMGFIQALLVLPFRQCIKNQSTVDNVPLF